jgi:alginate O-acetyltransferase complex protein AlgJ
MFRRVFRFIGNVLVAMAFVAGISTPAAVMLMREEAPATAATENRVLAERPEWSWNRAAIESFPAAFEKHFDDAFGLRDALTRWHHLANFRVFGNSPTSTVVVGQDGWLFLDYSMKMFRRETPCHEPLLRLQTNLLQQRHDWLAARGIKYLVVIVPNKPEVYPQNVPAATSQPSPESFADRFEAYAKQHCTFEILNLRPALVEASKSELTFGPGDCHWNDFGGFVGYREIIETLSTDFHQLKPIGLADCTRDTREVTADLMHIMGFPELKEPRVFIAPTVRRAQGLDAWRGIKGWTVTTHVDDARLPTAVILHDSFMTAPSPFLAEHFQTATFRWIYAQFDAAAIEQEKPDIVIQEMVERTIPQLHFNPPEILPQHSQPVARPPIAARPQATITR